MSNVRGSKLRHVATVYAAGRYYTWVRLDCGHATTRPYHLAVGQRVFCQPCGGVGS